MIRFRILVFLLPLLGSIGACHDSINHPRNEILRIDGSSTVYTITEAIAEEYLKENPGARLTIGVSGTGGGFNKFIRGETMISNASRKMKEVESEACRKNGITYLEIPIAYDGLAVIVNPKNTWTNHLTVAELKKIWEPEAQNQITQWNQIRPEFPTEPLKLYGPGTASGTFDYFTEVIVGTNGSSRGDFMPSEDDHILVQGVAGDTYSLGFVGYAYYEEHNQRLKLIAVDAGKGPIKPNYETISNNTYSPLTRPMYIYISNKITGTKQGPEFIEYFLKNAPALIRDVGYIPLSLQEYQRHWSTFKTFITQQNKL